MKKIVLVLALVAACVSARADLVDQGWTWAAPAVDPFVILIPLQGIPEEDATGYGVGWYAEAFNLTDAGSLGWTTGDLNSIFSTEIYSALFGPGNSPVEYGDIGLGGYMLGEAAFTPATDLDSVQVVMYNNADKNLATKYITSLVYALPDAPDSPDPDAVKVTFDFTGQTWQAIPEPTTVLLFGIGGMGAWLLRRRQQA